MVKHIKNNYNKRIILSKSIGVESVELQRTNKGL